MMRIRPIADADLPRIERWMRDSAGAPAWSGADLAGIVKAPLDGQRRLRKGWIAEEENRRVATGFVVATALCVPAAAAECELEFVFVSPQDRGQGISGALVQTVFAWARDLGAEEIRLEVRASNTHALRLYERCGFTVAGNRPGYYTNPPEDAVLMRCRIDYEPGDATV